MPSRILALFACALAQVACAAREPCDNVHIAPEAPHLSAAQIDAAKADIAKLLDDWHDAAAKADEERYFAHLHEDAVFLGTDQTERWGKKAFRDYAHPHFAKGKAWSFKSKRRDVVVQPRGDVAYFDEDLETLGLGPARGSGVAVQAGGRWQLLQYNLAITVPNDRFDTVKEAAGRGVIVPPDADMEPLGSFSGSWIGTTSKGEAVEEHWTAAIAGTLIGSGRTIKDGKTVFFEHLRIERRPDGSVVYVAQPLGKPPTELKRTSPPSNSEVVFENPKHDWPKKLTYRWSDGKLTVRVEGGPKQPVDEWTMTPAIVKRAKAVP